MEIVGDLQQMRCLQLQLRKPGTTGFMFCLVLRLKFILLDCLVLNLELCTSRVSYLSRHVSLGVIFSASWPNSTIFVMSGASNLGGQCMSVS